MENELIGLNLINFKEDGCHHHKCLAFSMILFFTSKSNN